MKRFYLSNKEKTIGGVCGGFAESLEIDPTIVRLLFIAGFLSPLPAGTFYLLCWIVMDYDPGYSK